MASWTEESGVTYANWNEVKKAMLARFKQVTSEVAATLAIHDLSLIHI